MIIDKYLKQQKDSELVLTLDDKKEITGWTVINTKTRMSSEEATGQSCHALRVANNAAFKAMSYFSHFHNFLNGAFNSHATKTFTPHNSNLSYRTKGIDFAKLNFR